MKVSRTKQRKVHAKRNHHQRRNVRSDGSTCGAWYSLMKKIRILNKENNAHITYIGKESDLVKYLESRNVKYWAVVSSVDLSAKPQ